MAESVRLFFVAPDNVHLTLSFDWRSNSWRVRVCDSVRGPDGEFSIGQITVYEDLTIPEALQVAEEDLRSRLDPL
jgi:hypothetical protein